MKLRFVLCNYKPEDSSVEEDTTPSLIPCKSEPRLLTQGVKPRGKNTVDKSHCVIVQMKVTVKYIFILLFII